MKIGIIKEGKTPPDKRVALSPQQCRNILDNYPTVELYVEESAIRKFSDDDYRVLNIPVVKDVSHCDVLMGVKEVPLEQLIPNKKYFFFSHTLKKQPYNRKLLKAVLEKNIQLIDWETITDERGQRLIAFGRYAGIVGAYNGFLAWGKKMGTFDLKPANLCEDRKEMESELAKVKLPSNFKMVITGSGRVGGGAIETIRHVAIKEVEPAAFLTQEFNEPVYTVLGVEHYNKAADNSEFDKKLFYKDPSNFVSNFMQYAIQSDMYMACHYWDNKAPFIFTRKDVKHPEWKIKVVADISCDVDCAVACTIQASTIADPIYGYDPFSESVTDYTKDGVIAVMAVDNLPCELPKDASVDFGEMFINNVLEPLLGNDPKAIIDRASETKDGKLTPHFAYLQDYVDGK
jgi:saccharopine dehydrogenase (NAD+, L-lysine-forming)